MIDVRLGGQQVPQKSQGLHDHVGVEVRQQAEYLVRTQALDDLHLYALLRLESDILVVGNKHVSKKLKGHVGKKLLNYHKSPDSVEP